MILDKELQLSDKQVITASAKSTNTIDLGKMNWAKTSRGGGDLVPLVLAIDETFVGAGATLSIAIRTSPNSDMTAPEVRLTTAPIPVASLVAGADLSDWYDVLRLPDIADQYVDAFYTVATGPFTAGKVSLTGATGRQINK